MAYYLGLPSPHTSHEEAMNIFVAVALKHTANLFSIAHGAFEKYLPARSSRQDTWISPNGRIFLFSFIVGPGGPDGISSTVDGSACVYDGIFLPRNRLAGTDQVANWPLSHLLRLEGHRDFAGEGEFAVAWTDGQSLFCRSNGSTHNLYMTDTTYT